MDENPAALEHIAAMCERFPHHFGLAQLHFEWLGHKGLAGREFILKKMIEIHPANPWTRVEYAYDLAELNRLDEAHAQLDEAEPLEPDGPNVRFARGFLYKKQQRIEDAQLAFREAIRKNVDYDPAIRELITISENLQDRRDSVAFIVSELLRQPTTGEGIIFLTNAIVEWLPVREVQTIQKRIFDARADLFQAWMVVGWQYENIGTEEEMLAHAQKSIQRFPARSELWLNVAQAHRYSGNQAAELQALERAVELSPQFFDAVRMLAEAHERGGDMDACKKVWEKAIQRAPLAASWRDELAAFYWRRNERDTAIAEARKALAIDPWYERAWTDFWGWSVALGRFDDVIALAKEWTQKRPGQSHMWARLAWAHQLNKQPTSKADDADRVKARRRLRSGVGARRSCPIITTRRPRCMASPATMRTRQAANPTVYKGQADHPTGVRARLESRRWITTSTRPSSRYAPSCGIELGAGVALAL